VTALAKQHFDEFKEFLLIEYERFRSEFPSKLTSALPKLKIHFLPDFTSHALKNEGVRMASGGHVVTHDLKGRGMEADLRRNAGQGTIATRLKEPALPWARLVRIGPGSIPVILAGKIFNSLKDCVRCGRSYGIRWPQLPAAMFVSIAVHLPEVPGMLQVYRGGCLKGSSFQ
jgi:hypothetical protein